jgi:hypothetical protein
MNKKLSAEKRAARQAQYERLIAFHEEPRLRLKPSDAHMKQMVEEMKKLAIQKGLPPISDEEALMEAQRFIEYVEGGLNVMKQAADAGKLSEEETAAIRALEPILGQSIH